MNSELTNTEKLRRIHWNTALTGFNSVFAQLTYFGSAFPLFLSELNFTNTEIGILLSFIPFFAMVALVVAPWAARFGYKRTFVTFFGLRKAVTTFLLFVPWVQIQFGTQAVFIYVIVVLMVFSLFRATAETAIYPWMQEFIPESIWGRYSAVNDIVGRLTGVAAIGLAGVLLALPMGIERYMLMFGIALAFGWAAVWAASHIVGGAPSKVSGVQTVSYRHLLGVLKDSNFVSYLVGLGLVTVGTGPIGSFLPLFMKREIGLSESHVVLLQVGTLLGGLAATYLLGWASDRYGSKPVMLVGLSVKIMLPFAWLLMPRLSVWSLPIALTIAVINGIADISWAIGSGRLLFIAVVPAAQKTQYMALYYATVGLIGGLSQVLGGYVVDAAAGLSGSFLFLTLDSFTPLFLAGIIFPFLGLFLFSRVRADSPVSVTKFTGLFIHGNPFLALEYMIRYYRAKDERTTVVMTERMGQTKSPLTVDELLEALRDPRFNVRFESIIAIARMDPDPRLIEALGTILSGTELSLSTISAWALGRMGNESALPALRQGLYSDYRSIQAHCARALGTLGDASIAPLLLERLQTETDKGLCIAYAAALGQLESIESLDALFRILNTTENEGARLELALSIVRVVGREKRFIELLRQERQDLGTATAQALTSLSKKLDGHASSHLIGLTNETANTFARNDFKTGIALLVQLVNQLPKEHFPEVSIKILCECEKALSEFEPVPLEYIILTLQTLEDIVAYL